MPLVVNINAYITHTTQIVEVIGSSTQQGIRGSRSTAALERRIPEESLKLVNWEKIYLHLIEYKQESSFTISSLMSRPSRQLWSQPRVVRTHRHAEIRSQANDAGEVTRLEELVITLLRKYIAKFYRIIQKQWSGNRVKPDTLKEDDDNFTDWIVYIPRDEAQELEPQIPKPDREWRNIWA